MIAPADPKPIPDLPGYYASADEGSIYSDRTGKLMKLYASDGPARIQQVNAYRDGRGHHRPGGHPVAQAEGHRRHHLHERQLWPRLCPEVQRGRPQSQLALCHRRRWGPPQALMAEGLERNDYAHGAGLERVRSWLGERLLGPCKTPQWVHSKGCLVLPHPSQVSVKPVHTPDDGYFASLAALQTECCPN